MSREQKIIDKAKSVIKQIKASNPSPQIKQLCNQCDTLLDQCKHNQTIQGDDLMKAPLAPASVGDLDYSILAPRLNDIKMEAAKYESTDKAVYKSILNFLNPDTKQYRFPDTVTNPTNLLRSIREFLVYANFDGSANSGRWSLAVQPSIGSISSLSDFAVAILDTSSGWPANIYDPNNYVKSANGQDPRIDPNLIRLLQNNGGSFAFAREFSSYTATAGVIDGFMLNPTNGVGTDSTLNSLNVLVTSFGTKTFSIGGGSLTVTNGSYYSIPPGTYTFHWSVMSTPNASIGNTYAGLLIVDSNDVIIGQRDFETFAANTGYCVTNGRVIYSLNPNVTVATTGLVYDDFLYSLRIVSGIRVIPFIRWGSSVLLGTLQSTMSIQSNVDAEIPSYDNSQNVSTLRPLGMSALFTNILPDLYAGGNLVAYSAPSGDVRSLFAADNDLGEMQYWEQLALLNKGNLMHDGPQKDGCFVFTQPWSENDLLLRSPSDLQAHSYQGIIMSGQVSAGASLTGVQAIGRLRVITTYEYVTDSPIFQPKALAGSGLESGQVLSFLSATQHAMPNKTHLGYLNKLAKDGLKLVTKTVPEMIRGISTLSAMF